MQNLKRLSQFFGISLLILFFTLSCNRVNFSSQKTEGAPGDPTVNAVPGNPANGNIQCDVFLNGNLKSVTMVVPGTNPKVSAACTPAAVTYAWTVTRGGSPVTVNGLQGPESTPDFVSLGAGVYTIVLRASAQSFNDYTNSAAPLTVTITSPTVLPNVTCSPGINGSATSVTLTNGTPSPEIKANCQPPTATCSWTVTRAGATVMVPGFTSCTSIPDFSMQPAGAYTVYVTATQNGYNTYTAPNPLTVTVTRPATTRDVTTTKLVTTQDNQLDVQLIIDDSKSMLADNQKLASRLQGFVNDLKAAGFDWQM